MGDASMMRKAGDRAEEAGDGVDIGELGRDGHGGGGVGGAAVEAGAGQHGAGEDVGYGLHALRIVDRPNGMGRSWGVLQKVTSRSNTGAIRIVRMRNGAPLRGIRLLALLGAAALPLPGQVQDANAAFDVASIRVTTSSERDGIHIWSSPADGNFRAQNVSVVDLLEFAYGLPESRFVAVGEAKGLLRAPRFDLEAKSSAAVDERMHGLAAGANGDSLAADNRAADNRAADNRAADNRAADNRAADNRAKEEKRKMVRALLAERFQLKTHMETRELPIYTLVVAKGGPKFTGVCGAGGRRTRWAAAISRSKAGIRRWR